MQPIEKLLEGRAQLIVQRSLTRKEGVAARFWGSDHPEHGISRWIGFLGMIRVIFSSKIGVCTNITTFYASAFAKRQTSTSPGFELLLTCCSPEW